MKVTILKTFYDMKLGSVKEGQEIEVKDDDAKRLSKDGYIAEVKVKKAKK